MNTYDRIEIDIDGGRQGRNGEGHQGVTLTKWMSALSLLAFRLGKRSTYSRPADNTGIARNLLAVDGIGGSKAKGDDLSDGDLHLE